MQRKNKVDTIICLRIGDTSKTKTPSGDFKVTTPVNPLLSQQAVISKGILVPYTNLQLNPYPNTQLDLFCSDNLSFQCTTPSTWLTNWCMDPSTWLTTNLRRILVVKFFSSSIWWRSQNSLVTKLLGYKTLRYTNTVASLRERWTRANSVFGHNLDEHNFALHSRNFWRPLKQSLYMFRVVRKESPNMYSLIELKSVLKN